MIGSKHTKPTDSAALTLPRVSPRLAANNGQKSIRESRLINASKGTLNRNYNTGKASQNSSTTQKCSSGSYYINNVCEDFFLRKLMFSY